MRESFFEKLENELELFWADCNKRSEVLFTEIIFTFVTVLQIELKERSFFGNGW